MSETIKAIAFILVLAVIAFGIAFLVVNFEEVEEQESPCIIKCNNKYEDLMYSGERKDYCRGYCDGKELGE